MMAVVYVHCYWGMMATVPFFMCMLCKGSEGAQEDVWPRAAKWSETALTPASSLCAKLTCLCTGHGGETDVDPVCLFFLKMKNCCFEIYFLP